MKAFLKKIGMLVAMLLTLLPANAYDFKVEGFYYNLVSPTELTCEVASGDEKYEGDFTIPSEVVYNGRSLSVIGIGNSAFKDCDKLTSIKALSVVSIGYCAFENCISLMNVELPMAVELGNASFRGCITLETIELPSVIDSSHSSSAFLGCTSLKSARLPQANVVPSYMFYGCTALSYVEMPQVTLIERHAFMNCTSLKSVHFPLAAEIMDGAFYNCTSLTMVDFPNVTTIESNEEKGWGCFRGCTSLKSAKFPKALSVGYRMFENCSSLTNVEFPKATDVYACSFYGCSSISTVEFPEADYVDGVSFRGCSYLSSVKFPKTLIIGASAFEDCVNLKSIEAPNVKKIWNDAFRGCTGLETISLQSIESLGAESFYNCKNLKCVQLGDKLTSLEAGTFYGCESLEQLDIPGSVGTMCYYNVDHYGRESLFGKCDKLTSVRIEHNDNMLTSYTINGSGYKRSSDIIFAGHIFSSGSFTHRDVVYLPVKQLFLDRELPNDLTLPYLEEVEFGEHVLSAQIKPEKSPELKKIVCNSIIPPKAPIFTDSQYDNVKVTVPDEALEAYMADEVWQKFMNLNKVVSADVVIHCGHQNVEIGRFDLNGRPVAEDYEGLAVVRYSDGSARKVIGRK